jgi:predicted nucleic acid-binding protein
MTVDAVLDTSALVGYARGSVAVGELIMLVAEEDGQVGVPVACLAEAYGVAKGVEAALLEYLSTALPVVAVLPMELSDARRVGEMSRRAGLGLAHAAVAASRASAYLATEDAAAARRILDESVIIDLARVPDALG